MELINPPSPTNRPRWYVIQAKPREDRRACENLERQGFSCYFPTLKAERWPHGKGRYRRAVVVDEALFPGYFFIHLDRVNDNWYCIRSTRGVNQIVRFHDYPTPVADEVIEFIRQRQVDAQTEPYLKPGDRVVVTDRAFSHAEAIFVAKDGQERVRLLLRIMQKEHALSFPATSVRKVPQSRESANGEIGPAAS